MIYYVSKESKNYSSSASYNRMRLLSMGMKKCGADVEMKLLINPSPNSKIGIILSRYVFSYFRNTLQLLCLLSKVNKQDIVILCGEFDQYWIFSLFGKKTNLVIERTEYPSIEIYEHIGRIGSFFTRQNLKSMKHASALLTCSSYLKAYFHQYIEECVIVPLVVDDMEFTIADKGKSKEMGEYIAYCGSFNNNKDGLPILLDAFNRFYSNHPQVRLVLIGTGTPDNLAKFKKAVKQYGIEDAVVFTGVLPHNEVGAWLVGATMLALARPNNKQAEGGIPSKVGEYLSSGVPCVITRTGDLPDYLHDGYDCFICQPDSAEAFAQRLEDCYQSNREEVGARGRQTAKKQFNYRYQAKHLLDFFNQKYGL